MSSDGTLLASPYALYPSSYSTDSPKYTFAMNLSAGVSYMDITAGYRAPGHVVWEYNVTVIGWAVDEAVACANTTTTVPSEVEERMR